MTKQEAIKKIHDDFEDLLEFSKKHPKTHCHFPAKIEGKEQQIPCFMLDSVIAVLSKIDDIVGSIDE